MDEVREKLLKVLQSRPFSAINLSELPKCYRKIHQEGLDFHAFGFENLKDMLATMPDLVRVSFDRKSSEDRVFLVNNEVGEALLREPAQPSPSSSSQDSGALYHSRYDDQGDSVKEKRFNRLREKPIPTQFRDKNDWELYFNNFPKDSKEGELMEIFKEFNCTRIRIKKKDDQVFGFATFKSYDDAETAYTTMDRSLFHDRRLNIQFARSSIAPEELVRDRLEKTQFNSEVKSTRYRSNGTSENTSHNFKVTNERCQNEHRTGIYWPWRQTSASRPNIDSSESSSLSFSSCRKVRHQCDEPMSRTQRAITNQTVTNGGINCHLEDKDQLSLNRSDEYLIDHEELSGKNQSFHSKSNIMSSGTDDKFPPSNFSDASREVERQKEKYRGSKSTGENLEKVGDSKNDKTNDHTISSSSFVTDTDSKPSSDSVPAVPTKLNKSSDFEIRACTKQVIYVRDKTLLQKTLNRIWNKKILSIVNETSPFNLQNLNKTSFSNTSSFDVETNNSAKLGPQTSSLSIGTSRSHTRPTTVENQAKDFGCCDTTPDSMKTFQLQRMLRETKLQEGYLSHQDLQAVGQLNVIVLHVCDSNHFWGSVVNPGKLLKEYETLFGMMSDVEERAKQEFQLDVASVKEKRAGVLYGDQDWCRVWIKSRVDASRVEVFYVDYGNSELRLSEDLYVLSRKCWRLRPLALPFHLSGNLENEELARYTNKRISLQLVSPQPTNIGFVLVAELSR